ncbi:hypothetical protein Acor_54840 [Acrocarpospora corrugata]|uniref:Methyltransferase domain-containing protein n=1 Tax=Acrocarpospora corrugata TaxID=35763 RepID=A0A5M3WA91_9ACTN|nr:class I SAM-dependent methyltransferase [Acrocarpospora corrugata]GES03418.1 hypothetical protein Acor_54840 [Acrocarpospora corrugata]
MTLSQVHEEHLATLRSLPVEIDEQGMKVGDTYVMFFAEAELMSLHANALLGGMSGAHVLEVGLGLGVFAQQAAAHRPASYTAIEPHSQVASMTRRRVLREVCDQVTVYLQPWQLVPPPQAEFDAIMYDTWPPDGLADRDFETFVRRFAIPGLKPGGRFSFFSSGPVLSAARAEIMAKCFTRWEQYRYTMPEHLRPPAWTKPTREFVVPVAIR